MGQKCNSYYTDRIYRIRFHPPTVPRHIPSFDTMLRTAVSLAVFAALASLLVVLGYAMTPISLPADSVDFSISPGSSLRSAARQMNEAGIPTHAGLFELLARVSRNHRAIKAGSYELSLGATPWDLLRKITSGDFSMVEVVFIEGWTFRQIRAALDAHPSIRHDSTGLGDAEIMNRLGSDGVPAEGRFFPDTYLFGKGESDLAVLARANRAMNKRLESAWSRRATDLPLRNADEALILASIVEKETGSPKERALIAGVFINRLRIRMPLQTDPTVIYGLGPRFDGNLRKRDLLADTPFNTYTRNGLPPHPIANPGAAALLAAVTPERTDALYFVARGDGTHQFSSTLDEHNRAVSRYQRQGK